MVSSFSLFVVLTAPSQSLAFAIFKASWFQAFQYVALNMTAPIVKSKDCLKDFHKYLRITLVSSLCDSYRFCFTSFSLAYAEGEV